MSYPKTTDTPTRISFLPDWREGVSIAQIHQTTIQRSRAGLEQRNRRRNGAKYSIEFTRTGLTEAEAKDRLKAIRAEFRGPLTVPVWTDGCQLQADMGTPGAAVLASNPVDGEWLAPLDVLLWHPDHGIEWRECSEVDGRNLTLDGLGTLYPAGSWLFPGRLMIRELGEGMLAPVDVKSGIEFHRYRTI